MENETDHQVVNAIVLGDRRALQKALSEGASANAKMASSSALSMACLQDRSDLVSELLEHGADVNVREADGATPLFAAASVSSITCVELLLKAGADPNVRNEIGQTVLMVASRAGDADSARALLASGADAKLLDRSGRNALHWAMAGGDFPVLAGILTEAGINPLARSADGDTAIDYGRKLERQRALTFLT